MIASSLVENVRRALDRHGRAERLALGLPISRSRLFEVMVKYGRRGAGHRRTDVIVERRGVSNVVAAVAAVVLVVVAGGVAVLYLPTLSGPPTTSSGTSSSTASTGTSTSTTLSHAATVIIPQGVGLNANLNFEPASLKVVIGVNNTIQWVQQDSVPHNVVSSSVPSGAQSFSSETLTQGMTYSVTLTVPGTYKYLCQFHPTYMLAEITVLQS